MGCNNLKQQQILQKQVVDHHHQYDTKMNHRIEIVSKLKK